MPKLQDITGKRFGRLVVDGFSHRTESYAYYWKCLCDCGETCVVWSASLKMGRTKSCGCFQAEARKTNHRVHGMYLTPTWYSWSSMHKRCGGQSPHHKKYYQDRGIAVCKRWSDFNNFYADMGERPTGKTLDRLDNDDGYSPANCRWASAAEQRHNRRDYKKAA